MAFSRVAVDLNQKSPKSDRSREMKRSTRTQCDHLRLRLIGFVEIRRITPRQTATSRDMRNRPIGDIRLHRTIRCRGPNPDVRLTAGSTRPSESKARRRSLSVSLTCLRTVNTVDISVSPSPPRAKPLKSFFLWRERLVAERRSGWNLNRDKADLGRLVTSITGGGEIVEGAGEMLAIFGVDGAL